MSSSIINLPFAPTNPAPTLLYRRNWQRTFAEMPEIWSWNSFREEYATQDEDGLLTVEDRSGKGHTLTRTSNTPVSPALIDNAILDHDAAHFSNGGLDYGGLFPTTAYSKVIVMRIAPGATAGGTLFGRSPNPGHRVTFDYPANRVMHQVQNSAIPAAINLYTASGSVIPGTWQAVIATFDGAAQAVRVKIDEQPTISSTVAGLNVIQQTANVFGFGNASGGVPSNTLLGDIADTMVFNVDILSAGHSDKLTLVRGYLDAVYGLAV